MTDPRHIPPRDMSPEGPQHTRKIPPLVWVILALVIGALGYGLVGGGLDRTHSEQAKATATP